MANVQSEFETFHDNIKLSQENEILRKKREILKKNLQDNLPEDAPKIDKFLLQGSYAIYTGINPPNDDYDIDVGVVFDCTKDDYKAMKLKNMVKDALEHTSRTPKIKTPCITVQYKKNGENDYHVDMPVYVKREDEDGYDLAWGKSPSTESWEQSDPVGLVDKINSVSEDDAERAQFRRIVKYLKAWKSKKITSFNLPSIGLTLGALENFTPNIDFYDKKPNDLIAMRDTVKSMLNYFICTGQDDNGKWLYRYEISLPVTPNNNVFQKLTDKQITSFKEKLETLYNALDEAKKESLPEIACEILQKQFGDDFPIPTKEETAKASVLSMNNTGSSS